MSCLGWDFGEWLCMVWKWIVSLVCWLLCQINDFYVKKVKVEGYCSCVVYKLIELDECFGLLCGVECVIDFGIVFGGWSQVVCQCCFKVWVVGIDFFFIELMEGVIILQMDFMVDEVLVLLMEVFDGLFDFVLFDMVVNIVGYKQIDYLCMMGLVEIVVDFVMVNFVFGGVFVVKVLVGGVDVQFLVLFKCYFIVVKYVKLFVSCKDLFEWYVIVQGFKGVV